MQEVQTVLERYGFVLARIRGSHHIFEYDQGSTVSQIVVPLHGRKVKKVYVERVVELLDDLFPLEDEPEEEDEQDS